MSIELRYAYLNPSVQITTASKIGPLTFMHNPHLLIMYCYHRDRDRLIIHDHDHDRSEICNHDCTLCNSIKGHYRVFKHCHLVDNDSKYLNQTSFRQKIYLFGCVGDI